jgi:hypothetical protein
MGHLQAQTARAARDQGHLAGQIKKLLDGACHGVFLSVLKKPEHFGFRHWMVGIFGGLSDQR